MKKYESAITPKLLGIIFLLTWITLNSSLSAEPTSGYIATVEYGVNQEGQTVGQKRAKRIWFQGSNVRIENLIGDDLVEVTVGGDNSWSAAPAVGRMLVENQPRDPKDHTLLPTYPETIRRSFARFFNKKPQVGEEDIKGVPSWKYSWHEEALDLGDVKSAAQDVSYWVNANEQFPFVLARQSSTGGRQDLIELRLNVPVAPKLFLPPKDLVTSWPFQLPRGKFLIEFQEKRESAQYGWKLQSSDLFEGNGEKVTRTYRQNTTNKQGKVDNFAPPVETLSYMQAGSAIENRLQLPDWMFSKRTGRDTLLNLPTDTIENVIAELPKEKAWVTDHPLLGTICLRRITEMPTDTSDRGVARLEITPAS